MVKKILNQVVFMYENCYDCLYIFLSEPLNQFYFRYVREKEYLKEMTSEQ